LLTRRRALIAACVANGIEWYDFAVYGALASVLAVVLLPPGAADGRLVAIYAIFATTFLARPAGALLVGTRADRLGRRRTLAAMVLPMAGATCASAALQAMITDESMTVPRLCNGAAGQSATAKRRGVAI
jgi:MHS family proline/betaine transporter-like MFS transporter